MPSPGITFTCPLCSTKLLPVGLGARVALQCRRGDGLYLEPAAQKAFFSAEAQRELARRARAGPPASKFCPRCSRSMTRFAFRGFELDACARCRGIWFDRGELHATAGGGGTRKAAQPPGPGRAPKPAAKPATPPAKTAAKPAGKSTGGPPSARVRRLPKGPS